MSSNKNLGSTSLKRKRRAADPMREYDNLPPELRAWLSTAILPWRPRSVQRSFERFYAQSKNKTSAILELDKLQHRRVAQDGRKVWGAHYPDLDTLSELR
ncbi:MAG: DUF6525 family protein [Pseudomonadota bacterium]